MILGCWHGSYQNGISAKSCFNVTLGSSTGIFNFSFKDEVACTKKKNILRPKPTKRHRFETALIYSQWHKCYRFEDYRIRSVGMAFGTVFLFKPNCTKKKLDERAVVLLVMEPQKGHICWS